MTHDETVRVETLLEVADLIEAKALARQAHHMTMGKGTSNRQAWRFTRAGHQIAAARSIARMVRELAAEPVTAKDRP